MAEAAPRRVGRDEQLEARRANTRVERDERLDARRANTTPNGGPHLELGRLRLTKASLNLNPRLPRHGEHICICIIVIFSSVFELISSYEHF